MNLAKTDIDVLIKQANTSQILTPQQLIPLLDLTSLNNTDNETTIQQLCNKAITSFGNVAAVCIYPQFVRTAHDLLKNTAIKIATVANFPAGDNHLTPVIKNIEQAIENNADEIDLVMPYQAFLAGDTAIVEKFILASKEICGKQILLKVILETGALQSNDLIYTASRLAIENGADFIKTSTGKIQINATLEAAAYMLLAIKDSGRKVGFKAAGGIRTIEQATSYVTLTELILGKDWITPQTFRLGASSLLDALLQKNSMKDLIKTTLGKIANN